MISLEAIIVIGLARSGKDTVADYLERKHGYKKLVFSDLISEELQRQGLEVNKTNMSNIANDMRTQHGMDVLAKRMVEKMKKMREEKFVLVGPRSPEELSYVKKNCSKCIALKVETEREERFERKSESELASMYGMCDACFTVSSREGFGLGTMEAAACGLPIVVPDVGGLKDQVVTPEGKNVGVLKRPTLTNVVLDIEGNLVEECYVREKEISDSLRWLYRMRRSKRRAIGEACREHVTKEFSIKRMLDGFFSLMERVTK